MSFPLEAQTVYFLYSLLFGVFLSALYDIVRMLRFAGINSYISVVVTDVVYCVLCAFLTFLFALPFNNGAVRYFVLFGESVGFIVYRFTLGELNSRFYCVVIALVSKIIKKSMKYIRLFLNKLLQVNRQVVYNVVVLMYKIQNIVFRKRKTYEHK